MITQIDLHHFKCFEILKLPLAKLNLLSGANASGKSSVLQALVLLHQTIKEHEWSTRLMLNGNTLKMGTVMDVIDKVHGRHSFEIGLTTQKHIYRWLFSGERTGMSLIAEAVHVDRKITEKPDHLQYLLPTNLKTEEKEVAIRLRKMAYITAERIGPREFYSLEDPQKITSIGPTGEYAVSLLHSNRDEKVIQKLVLNGTPPTLFNQVGARMEKFFPGCALNLTQVPHTNAVTLGIRVSEDTDFHRPVHVGFGLTQVLPLIIAVLAADEEDILLIENPEVHLHPAGQALMGEFLAEAANAGIQIIIETHSDHILNGIRRAVKAGKIKPEDSFFHFFKPRNEKEAQVISPQIDHNGNIDFWPNGFFDQFDKDLNYFADWGS